MSQTHEINELTVVPQRQINEASSSSHHSDISRRADVTYRKLKSYGRWVFIAQIFLIYLVSAVALVNLTLNHGEGQLWTVLLSSSVGYLLPSPSLKPKGYPVDLDTPFLPPSR